MTQAIRALLAGTALLGAVALAPASAQQPNAGPSVGQNAASEAEAAKMIELTQRQIDGLVAAQAELAKLPPGDPKKPDPKIGEKVEAIAKKAGFASSNELGSADDTVETVLEGVDPETKAYVGPSAILKKQIAEVEADKNLPAKEKQAALKELKEALAAGDGPKPSPGNIALVTKNFDKLSQIQGDQ